VQQRYFTEPYRFVPPYRGQWWCRLAQPLLTYQLRRQFQVPRWQFRGLDLLRQSLHEGAGILLAPNHTRWADAAVMGQLSIELRQYFYYVVSAHMFKQGRWQAWWLNRLGSYSILREGADHEAIRVSSRILADADRPLVIFPEGTWFRQNDRLGSLQEGVSLIVRHAARTETRPIVVHPIAVKYWALADPRPVLHQRLERMEGWLSWQPQQLDLLPRIEKLSGALLSLKEIEHFGTAQAGPLAERIRGLAESHIAGLETKYGCKPAEGVILDRLRPVRQRLVRQLQQTADKPDQAPTILRELDTLLFCENLAAHSQEYLHERPSFERLIETVQRIEETATDAADEPVVPLGVVVEVGPPLRVSDFPRGKPSERAGGDPLIKAIGVGIQGMLDRLNAEGPPPEWNCPQQPIEVEKTGLRPVAPRTFEPSTPAG